MRVSAVSVTNRHAILAHVGAGSDHHIPTRESLLICLGEAIETGRIQVVRQKPKLVAVTLTVL